MRRFKDYVAKREKVDEGLFSTLGYAFDRMGTSDPTRLAAADAIDAFGKNYMKNREVQKTTAQNIPTAVGAMPGKNTFLKKSADNLNKNLGKVGDDWEDLTQAAVTRKVPVRSTNFI